MIINNNGKHAIQHQQKKGMTKELGFEIWTRRFNKIPRLLQR